MPSLIVTNDGSHSLLNEQLNETYHSTHGAIQESIYVFIEKGLQQFFNGGARPIRILEVGFGTGLNALLAYQFSQTLDIDVAYHTLEAYPLDDKIWSQLNYSDRLGMRHIFNQLHSVSWNESHHFPERFTFRKSHSKLEDENLATKGFDVVFYDAFAPSKQPGMWTKEILSKVYQAMGRGGIFVTYCAKGQVKRDLRELGLEVETLPGPPGKKEMIRARRP
jgi:tRNA U34 5-methylaminomethyl-2-thiouridine-forming methyltransferase MnmC